MNKTSSKKAFSILSLYVILLCVLLLVVGIASFAWFMTNDKVEIQSGSEMNVTVGSRLEVAEHLESGERQWGSALKLDKELELSVLDCSGDGKKFYSPEVLDGNDGPVSGTIDQLTNLKGYVIEIPIDIRSSHKLDVYLGSLSSVLPAVTALEGAGHNKSMFGEFSAGYISGAVRVAFLEVEYGQDNKITKEELKFVWAPNSKVELVSNADGTYELNNPGKAEEDYEYISALDTQGAPVYTSYTDEQKKRGDFLLAEGGELCTTDQIIDGTGRINQSRIITSFTEDGVLQEKNILIRVWFEGTDRECDKAFTNGLVKYNFSLTGVIPKAQPNEEILYANDTFTVNDAGGGAHTLTIKEGYEDSFVYSLDGITWAQLSVAGRTFEADITKIYVRIKETQDTMASSVRELSFVNNV